MTKAFIRNALLSLLISSPLAMQAHADDHDSYELRVGVITANDAQEYMGRKFVELVEEKTNGKIKGRVYPAGALGSNDEVMRGLRLGSIQANINPSGYLNQFVAPAGVLTLPWVF